LSGNDENDPKPAGDGEDRTVFMPLPGALQGGKDGEATPPSKDAKPEGEEAGETPEPEAAPEPSEEADAPVANEPAEAEAPAEPSAQEPAELTESAQGGSSQAFLGSKSPATAAVAAGEARQIQVGDVLNHIFEVRRFIARGGMGEVFEGINVNTDERVAIKVILPHLAADEAVQAMFRKEARTLTRLSHPGLVQYRVLAQEPQLGALYIVTEYIDGVNLSDQFGELEATPKQLIGLLRKLAEGLQAAHDLGAIHRDISPDNIMLDEGRLENAKIIDFGIAKDLEGAGQTIVGDGFAGKLNYVAPEQLGDYNRDVGPWTDVYSLALTIIAVAMGRDVNMGATLVEAVDRRRAGIDLSDVPEELCPVLEAMLRADPAQRLRSMNDVLAMLDNKGLAPATGFQPHLVGMAPAAPASGGMSKGVLGLIGAGVLAVVAVGGWLAFGGDDKAASGAGAGGEEEVVIGPPPEDPVAAAREAATAEFATIPCSWLDIVDVQAEGTSAQLSLRGVSGRSAQALDILDRALARAGLTAATIDLSDVSPIPANFCRAVEAFNVVRAPGPGRLDAAQRKFEMGILPPAAGADAGKLGSEAVLTLDLNGLDEDLTLVGLNERGEMEQLPITEDVIKNVFENVGNDKYRFRLNTTHSGWSGVMLLTGKGPFNGELLTHSGGTLSTDWVADFEKAAKERNWKAEMVWYRTVDEVAN
jgi:serine/threonine-protein kinase